MKAHYISSLKNREEYDPNLPYPKIEKTYQKYVDLSIVNGEDVVKDAMAFDERKYHFNNRLNYKPVNRNDEFSKDFDLLLIAGIAGIGKTYFLQKCVLDWANNKLWEKFELLFYFECRSLNKCKHIGNLNSLIQEFYKDATSGLEINTQKSTLFVIDGLDEFFYLKELLKWDTESQSNHPIVNAMQNVLDQKRKVVLAGRVEAILKYRGSEKCCQDIEFYQIMGFNKNGIDNYIKQRLVDESNVKQMQDIFKKSEIAEAMASVPFYLSVMCSAISLPNASTESFQTLTQLYTSIFLCFVQNHGQKTLKGKSLDELLNTKEFIDYILNICKLSYNFLKDGKVILSEKKLNQLGINPNEEIFQSQCFLEGFQTQKGKKYQFCHLTLMEFCAAVYIYLDGNCTEHWKNKVFRNCFPMVCGLYKADPDFITSIGKSRITNSYQWLEMLLGKLIFCFVKLIKMRLRNCCFSFGYI